MKVLKFGGSSLSSNESIKQVKNILDKKGQCIVVVSAIGDTTDALNELAILAESGDHSYLPLIEELEGDHLSLAKGLGMSLEDGVKEIIRQLQSVCQGVSLLKELSPRSLDFILSCGESLSSYIISEFLAKEGISAKLLDPKEIIITDNSFGGAKVDFTTTNQRLKEAVGAFKTVNICPGFIAGTLDGETTTLGRGGSDYTASILAAGLGVESLEIWTDVSGIMTADPRLVRHAHTLDHVSYEEALELSHFGAKVIYYQSVLPVYEAGIPVSVKNTFNPEDTGTLISQSNGEDGLIKGISSIDGLSVLTLSGNYPVSKMELFSQAMQSLSREGIHCVFVSHSNANHAITLCIRSEDAEKAHKTIKQDLSALSGREKEDELVVEHGYALVALVGSNMKNQVGVSGNMFHVLGRNGVNIKAIAQGSSELNISAIISERDLAKSLNVLHESFFLSRMKRINLFIIGVGNVGKAFLDQITSQFQFLKDNHQLNLKVIGVANSRKMAFMKDGIPLSKWNAHLDEGEVFEKEEFIELMNEFNYRNSIFIDITASSDIADLYYSILTKSVSVVTPNKIAATQSFENYRKLKDVTRRFGSQFLIETNVCAGLPVLSTLNDLVRSGDQVHRMEAVLSGTLNFLFNEYDGSESFANIIKRAKELGYTEPDPRLDLSGEDVVRKILILIRESGYEMEMDDIQSIPFLPESCTNTHDLDEFYEKVASEESYFKQMYEKAKFNGTRLKVVASYEEGKGSVSLKEIDETHPFYHLEGKDNVVLFYTNRYNEQPLVIKGAGAGADVTASGIFADVLRIAQSDF